MAFMTPIGHTVSYSERILWFHSFILQCFVEHKGIKVDISLVVKVIENMGNMVDLNNVFIIIIIIFELIPLLWWHST